MLGGMRTPLALLTTLVVSAASTLSAQTTPAGATAVCRDSTYSFSAHRRGTCSHHGGVARWVAIESARAPGPDPTRWLRINRAPAGIAYVDRLRVIRVDSIHVEAWVRFDVPDSVFRRAPHPVDRIVDRWLIDCRRMEAVSEEEAYYYRDSVVEHFVVPLDAQSKVTAPPEGTGELLMTSACGLAVGAHVDTVP